MDLWRVLEPYVESGEENDKVELKQTVSLQARPERAEFARDIAAIANTPGGDGYLVIGVLDARKRSASTQPVVGFWPDDPDEFRRQIGECLSAFCDPPPRVSFQKVIHPPTGLPLAVVVVAKSFARPHVIKRTSGSVEEHDVWVRRGACCQRANRHEIEEMVRAQRRVIVLNFSHPLTDSQRESLRLELNCLVEEVRDVRVHFQDDRPFIPQARELVDSVGLTPRQWQTLPLVIVLPSLAEITAVVLAELHGRMGYFPTVIRRRRVSQAPPEYELAEVIDLQAVRDQGRSLR